MGYYKKNQPLFKNRLISEFIKADIRAGLALVGIADDHKFKDVHLQRRALSEAKTAYLTARELASESNDLSTDEIKWITENLYKLKKALQRLGKAG
jgi:hypothetical protein